MPVCTHRGCGKEYDADNNTLNGCIYHSGSPVFHEGLKSWSCCSDVNKPVLDFDEFMKIPGCTQGVHTDEKPVTGVPKRSPNTNMQMTGSQSVTETYSSVPSGSQVSTPTAPKVPLPSVEVVEEEEDLSAPVPPGTKCRHNGCQTVFESDAENRVGDGPGTVCTYHPKAPIFHEGSKGYLCCKRRVLEFDEFLKIQGCKTGRHVFVPKNQPPASEQFTDCRIDHYQTPTEVHVSVFAKKADQERSSVKIEETAIHLDLYLPGSKRFQKSLELFGPINPDTSTSKYYGTKVELILKKQDTRSWTILEKPTRDLGPVALTFGVGGRTGTIGAKDIILDETNKAKIKA
ncbi:chord-domain-containing protein [Wolfiporia cocos MD-104 SS10]|uniref:Chord-domain-containing protein n=1 Tax=Wolfiporia cocos (strain MD-104) TaxID=742152 RepID=A0A2H3J873_WOLCO|nr:chord-domain-containing protein [Wolfiporia cocos MD-104 SS10]